MVKYPTGSLTHYTKDQTDLLHPRKQKHRKDVVFSDRGMNLELQFIKSQLRFKLSKQIIPNVLEQSLKKLTSGKHLQLTIMAFIKVDIQILKLKKREIKDLFL